MGKVGLMDKCSFKKMMFVLIRGYFGGFILEVYFWSFKIKDFNYCKVKILGKMIVII